MPRDRDDDLTREIRTHLELEAEERVADGLPPEEAGFAARRAFGNAARVREDARAVWTRPWIDEARQDLRYAVRALAKTPGFTLVALITLALGIGATTAVFTVVNAVLLRPLPYPGSDRLVQLFEHLPAPAGSDAAPRRAGALTVSELSGFASGTRTLSQVGAHIPAIRTLTGREAPIRLVGARVAPAILSMTQTPPFLGRLFESHEDRPGADAVMILSHASWQRHFGGDPEIVGRRLDLDDRPHVVVGVMGPAFGFPDPQDAFWIPLTLSGPMMQQRLPVTAQLKDGESPAAAVAEINALIPRLRGLPPAAEGVDRFVVVRLQDLVVAPVKPALLILAGAVALVLLVACVNVANLVLARTAARHREMALRLALGAGRGRLVRQLLTENLVLALVGGAAGVALSFGGIQLLRTLAASLPRRDLGPGAGLSRLDEIELDMTALAFTFVASLVAGAVSGLLPLLQRHRAQPMDALRLGTASPMSGFNLFRRHGLQGVLVLAEVAMATTLFVGAGLLILSFVRLSAVNPGYDPAGVLTFQLSLPPGRSEVQLRSLADSLVERLQAQPDVSASGYAESLPLTRVSLRVEPLSRTPEGHGPRRPPALPITPDYPDTRFVSRDFLAAMGIPVVAGRGFGAGDGPGQPQALLVNRTLARSGLLGDSPLGTHVYALGPDPWQIVGIVEDVRQSSLAEDVAPQIFIDYRQVPQTERLAGVGLYFSVRTTGRASASAATIGSLAGQLDSQAMVENVAPMTQLLSNATSRSRLNAMLFGVFAGVAVVLAATGIYGVMAYAVAQRTREIGVRIALGAGRARIMALMLGQSGVVTLLGIALGLAGAAALTRYLDQLLFGLTALDGATFTASGLLFAAIATVAALVPARRATRIDPLTALRFD